MFFDKNWNCIGTRRGFAANISKASGISRDLVTSFHEMPESAVSTAEKLSWISRRKTSRREDLAYCLMGLLHINMPLLYGEGHGAFRRLQLEIIRSTNDESVFAWAPDRSEFQRRKDFTSFGLLRHDTNDFGQLLHLPRKFDMMRKPLDMGVPGVSRPPYTITNQGLELRVPKRLASQRDFYLPLNYRYFDENGLVRGVYAIQLQQNRARHRSELPGEDHWDRYIPIVESPPDSN